MNPLKLAALCAALFLAATLFSHTVALRLLLLFGGTALVIAELVRTKLRGEPLGVRIVPPLLIPFALWAAWALASMAWSLEPARTLKEFRHEIVFVFLAYWLCHAAAQARDAARTLPYVVATGAVAVCALALYQFWFRSPEVYAIGLHGGPGNHTSALLTLMPCGLVAAWLATRLEMRRSVRVATLALPVIFLASAYTTLNRTVWLGFAAQFLLLAALMWPRPEFQTPRSQLRRRLHVALVGATVVTGVVATMLLAQMKRIELGADMALANDPRFAIWASIIDAIGERPLMGSGFGRGIERHLLIEELKNPQLWHAHNLPLETAVQMGIPGLALLLFLLGATVYEGWKLARGPDAVAAACGAAIIAIVAGMLVRNLTDVLWVRQNALLYWGVVGALLAWGRARLSIAARHP